jgi:hypothetical protein
MARFKLVGDLNPRGNGKFIIRSPLKADGTRVFEVEVSKNEIFEIPDSLPRMIGSLENATNPTDQSQKLYKRVV